MRRQIQLISKKVIGYISAPFIINKYLKKTPVGQRKLILGGHWSNHPGWLVLNEEHQDITKKLILPSGSIDVIFLEHVLEHIKFDQVVSFLKEAKRILKKGGIIRIVCPFTDKMITSNLNPHDRKDKIYINNSLKKLTYPKLEKLLKSLGLKGVDDDPQTFFFNSLFHEQGHQFIWSSQLLKKVMETLIYKDVKVYNPGLGHSQENCIERKQRGIYVGHDWKKDIKTKKIYDPESLAVEGIK